MAPSTVFLWCLIGLTAGVLVGTGSVWMSAAVSFKPELFYTEGGPYYVVWPRLYLGFIPTGHWELLELAAGITTLGVHKTKTEAMEEAKKCCEAWDDELDPKERIH